MSSTTITSSPVQKILDNIDPIKPAPPVITIMIVLSLLVEMLIVRSRTGCLV